jgi:tetratricopeptide (TPR) repeat protein
VYASHDGRSRRVGTIPTSFGWPALRCCFLAGEQSAAARIIDRALALNPNSAHAWNASGWVCAFQSQPNRSIESLQHAIRLSPFDPLSWMFAGGLAFSYLARISHTGSGFRAVAGARTTERLRELRL